MQPDPKTMIPLKANNPELFESIFRTVPVGIAICNADSRIVMANKAWLDLFRCGEEDMIGRSSLDITHPEDRGITAQTASSLRSGALDSFRLEKRYLRCDGTHFWADMSASVIKGGREGGEESRSVMVVIQDITGRKILEDELEERAGTKAFILNSLSDNVVLHDANLGVIWANQAAQKSLPYDPEGVPGVACYKMWRNEDKPCRDCPVKEAVETGEFRQADIETPEGRIWQVKAFPALDDKGTVLGVVEVTTDITETRRVEKAMDEARALSEQANKAKTEFIANISHELRSPMNAVLGMLDLLLDSELDEEQRDFAETALKAGEGLLSIINDLLDFTKLQAESLILSKTPFDPRPILRVLADLFKRQYRGKDVELVVETDESVPSRLYTDEGRFRQILINIIGNAMKFTRRGSVRVALSYLEGPGAGHGPRLLCSVEDTGIGMDSGELSSVFEPFFQLNWGRSRKFEGTGLGMGIVKRLTEIMGGSLCIGSEIGQGTEVHFLLPVELS